MTISRLATARAVPRRQVRWGGPAAFLAVAAVLATFAGSAAAQPGTAAPAASGLQGPLSEHAQPLNATLAGSQGQLVDTTSGETNSPQAVHATVDAGSRIVSEAPLPGGGGFWAAYSNGLVVADGTAAWYGDLSQVHLNAPVVTIAATADGRGYWLVGADGGIFSFGDAGFYGSTGNVALNKPIVGMAATTDNRGYWLVGADGGIFSFGDAGFYGSSGGVRLNQPVVGMAATPAGGGYWLVASDGGIFSFGDAGFYGSTGGVRLNQPVVGMAATAGGGGYWMIAADGGIFAFGDAPFRGSAVGALGGGSAVGLIASGAGYWVLTSTGAVFNYDAPALPAPNAPLPSGANPASSTSPPAAFSQSCYTGGNVTACDSAALAAINSARAQEGLGGLILPADYTTLGVAAQLVAVADAERTSRGLPAMGENSALDSLALDGARAGADPTGPADYGWGSNISWGYLTPLAADFGWMYDDGPGGRNIDCMNANMSGCWGHRDNILSPWGGQMGAAVYVASNQVPQMTELFVENY